MGDDFGIIGVLDLGTAAVNHDHERHPPVVAGLADAAEVIEHLFFLGITDVDVAAPWRMASSTVPTRAL